MSSMTYLTMGSNPISGVRWAQSFSLPRKSVRHFPPNPNSKTPQTLAFIFWEEKEILIREEADKEKEEEDEDESAMKTRALKLKEAHKSNGSSSLCSILWDLESHHLVTASSSDLSISIHDLLPQNPKPPKTLRHHKDGVSAVALSPNSTCLASGSLDHCIKLYKFPSIPLGLPVSDPFCFVFSLLIWICLRGES